MTRLVLSLVTVLAVVGIAGQSSAGAPVEVERKHLCVITNSEKHEGYCLKTELPGPPSLP